MIHFGCFSGGPGQANTDNSNKNFSIVNGFSEKLTKSRGDQLIEIVLVGLLMNMPS